MAASHTAGSVWFECFLLRNIVSNHRELSGDGEMFHSVMCLPFELGELRTTRHIFFKKKKMPDMICT